MRRAVLSAAIVFVLVILQVTVVSELPWPGGGRPDLVLLAVVALGLSGGPVAGSVTGFGAGLALDIAPPGSYLLGAYALVFCLVGYGCGRLSRPAARSAWLPICAAVLASAAGEAMVAAVGLLTGDPQVTWPAIRLVLPTSVLYDVILSPFALFAVLHLLAWAGRLGTAGQLAEAASPEHARPVPALPGAGLLGGAGWLAGPATTGTATAGRGGPPHVPHLRDAAARAGDGWIGGGPASWRIASFRTDAWHLGTRTGRRAGTGPGAALGTAAAVSAGRSLPGRALPSRAVPLRLAAPRRRDGTVGNALAATQSPASRGAAVRYRGGGPAPRSFRGLSGASRQTSTAGAGRGTGRGALAGRGTGPRGSAFRGPGGAGNLAFHRAGSAPRGLTARPARVPGGAAFRREASSRSALSRAALSRAAMARATQPGSGLSRSALAGSARSSSTRSRSALSRSALSRSALSRSALSRSALSRSALSGSALSGSALPTSARAGSGLSRSGLARTVRGGSAFSRSARSGSVLSRSALSRSAISRSALSRSALSRSGLAGSALGGPSGPGRAGLPGAARSIGRGGGRRSLLAGSGAPGRGPRFRLDARMPGGSAFGSPARRSLPGRPAAPRLRLSRWRDGMVGASVAPRIGASPARRGRIRVGLLRRGDGTVGGLAAARFGYHTSAARPRFRGSSARGGSRRGHGSGLGKQARFRSSRRSLLPARIGGKFGSRYTMWRAGSRRTSGRLS